MSTRKYRSILLVLALIAMSWSTAWTDITTGLVSHWKMDDGTGLVATDSVGGNDGKQSMPLDYNNVKSPFYSEAERDFATVQDWTVGEVSTLALFVRGKLGNGPATLYLGVKDASNRAATVTNADATVIGAAKWTEWKIPLSSFTGVNLAKIKKLTIGLGDKANPKAGGAGRVYIDDIRVIRSAPAK